MRNITLIALMTVLAIACKQPCEPVASYATTDATWVSGCGAPWQEELDEMRESVTQSTACEADVSATQDASAGPITWDGTLYCDGDGYSGRLRRLYMVNSTACEGIFDVRLSE